MKATQITNATLGVKHFLKLEIRKNISIHFIKATKIMNVILVVNVFLKQDLKKHIHILAVHVGLKEHKK